MWLTHNLLHFRELSERDLSFDEDLFFLFSHKQMNPVIASVSSTTGGLYD